MSGTLQKHKLTRTYFFLDLLPPPVNVLGKVYTRKMIILEWEGVPGRGMKSTVLEI